MNTCTSLEGNPDLYGLGIRIGIYLQWISACISLLLDPESAQSTYDVNSIFVFAILVATIIAAQQGAARIEMYLMLQFMLGSFITSMSTLGIRLWLMSPDRLAQIQTTTTTFFKSFWCAQEAMISRLSEKLSTSTWKSLFAELWAQNIIYISTPIVLHLIIPLEQLSIWKPPGLTWSGVIWRLTIATLVASYNLAFWFGSLGSGLQQPPGQGCGPPYVFLFSRQQLDGTVFDLCRVAAIVIAVIIFPASLLLLQLLANLWGYTCLFLYRDLLYLLKPTTQRAFQSALDRINTLLKKQENPFIALLNVPWALGPLNHITLTDVLGFLATPKDQSIRFSDVIKVCVSLGRGEVMKNETEATPPLFDEGLMSGWKHANIVWFIMSIEYTIHWNNIHGVDTINTTGQLIPFIIGCVTSLQVIKRIMLFAWAKKYPDWADTQLRFRDGANGFTLFEIVKRNENEDAEGRSQ
ncbi:hypothetical protein N7494_007191 [Penicillium frequentans]|uniref:Uncharacterized protein n=1 Tax=Penicillium frequentans TaxID=3151616 RepID=A0AAD6CTP6_9EURO|nr:hypothetical protein N7494_007191 [Penicillium glabrum]